MALGTKVTLTHSDTQGQADIDLRPQPSEPTAQTGTSQGSSQPQAAVPPEPSMAKVTAQHSPVTAPETALGWTTQSRAPPQPTPLPEWSHM